MQKILRGYKSDNKNRECKRKMKGGARLEAQEDTGRDIENQIIQPPSKHVKEGILDH